MKKVILYSSTNCPHCNEVKKYFADHKIEYRLCNVQTAVGQKEFRRLGYRAVPVIKIGGQFMQGFNLKRFKQMYK